MSDKRTGMIFPEVMHKYLPLWVAISISLALFIGYRSPQSVKGLKPAIPFLLFVMLYPMMINLRVEDIGKALKDWKLFFVAVLMNFLLTPILGHLVDTHPVQPSRSLSRCRVYSQGNGPLQWDGGCLDGLCQGKSGIRPDCRGLEHDPCHLSGTLLDVGFSRDVC